MVELSIVGDKKSKGSDKAKTLTNKQDAFLRTMIEEEGITLSDAYRSAYDAKEMSPATIHSRAYELFHHGANGEIAGRYKEAMARKQERSLLLRDKRLDYVLDRLQKEAEGEGQDTNASSRVRAIELIGKISLGEGEGSVFEDRVAHADNRTSDDLRIELEGRLRRLLKDGSEEAEPSNDELIEDGLEQSDRND